MVVLGIPVMPAKTPVLPISLFRHVPISLYRHVLVFVPAGVWLLARCADLQGLGYSVASFWWCLAALGCIGVVTRVASIAAMFILHRS